MFALTFLQIIFEYFVNTKHLFHVDELLDALHNPRQLDEVLNSIAWKGGAIPALAADAPGGQAFSLFSCVILRPIWTWEVISAWKGHAR